MSMHRRYGFLFILITALSVPAFAGDYAAPHTVTTNGKGTVSVKADMAEVIMQTASTQKSASSAKNEVDSRINHFLKRLEEIGVDKEDFVASALRIAPEYEYENRSRIFSGYRAYRDITVTLRSLDKLDSLLETATDSNISYIQQIALKSSKEESLQREAFNKAIEDSKQKAQTLAKAYGAELGNIHTINYQSQQPIFVAKMETAAMVRGTADSGGGQYLHDDITFEDQISVVFELIVPR